MSEETTKDAAQESIADIVARYPKLELSAGIWATASCLDSHQAAIEYIDDKIRAAIQSAEAAAYRAAAEMVRAEITTAWAERVDLTRMNPVARAIERLGERDA